MRCGAENQAGARTHGSLDGLRLTRFLEVRGHRKGIAFVQSVIEKNKLALVFRGLSKRMRLASVSGSVLGASRLSPGSDFHTSFATQRNNVADTSLLSFK